MARTQSRKYPEIRKEIMRKAARLFARKGYPSTTIVDLAKACAASRGALYHYFDSKKAMLREILFGHLDEMTGVVREAVARNEDPVERLRAVIHAMVGLNARSQNEQVVLLNDLQYLDKKDRDAVVRMENDIVSVVADSLFRVDGGRKMDAANRKAYTMMCLGMINYTYLWYDPKGAVSADEYARMVADTFLDGFRAAGRR